jgi:hypothetical protein
LNSCVRETHKSKVTRKINKICIHDRRVKAKLAPKSASKAYPVYVDVDDIYVKLPKLETRNFVQ